ncbi:DUF4856 domain-containing protein [Flavobacteriaceae bacterium]|jgi:hypothetical protein|nr:DUF4856 domain-containing protein [Flavobacteriaceae bacterium]
MKRIKITLSILILLAACEKETELLEIPDSLIKSIADQAATSAANAVASTVTDAATTAVDNAFDEQAAEQANAVNDDPLPPAEYEFTRNGISTVYYSGQTARLKMTGELHSAFSDTSKSETDILAMFNEGTGFSDDSLNSSGKNVGGKTAASSYASTTVKLQIQAFISRVVNDVFPNYNNDASAGVAGKYTDPGGRTVHIDGKGFEMNQVFTKSLMGALVTDQIINGYLWRGKLDAGTNIANNDNLVFEYQSPTASNMNVTKMEHYWDEGFGYLYGEDNQYSHDVGNGVLVAKYLGKGDVSGLDVEIYNAFKLGRAAIVAGDYELKDKQAKVIKLGISKVIGYRAASYLRLGGTNIGNDLWANAFHALSEGYGFILSLQFTMKDDGKPYFTNTEVNQMLAELEKDNGFWSRTSAELNAMADKIDQVTGLSTQ